MNMFNPYSIPADAPYHRSLGRSNQNPYQLPPLQASSFPVAATTVPVDERSTQAQPQQSGEPSLGEILGAMKSGGYDKIPGAQGPDMSGYATANGSMSDIANALKLSGQQQNVQQGFQNPYIQQLIGRR